MRTSTSIRIVTILIAVAIGCGGSVTPPSSHNFPDEAAPSVASNSKALGALPNLKVGINYLVWHCAKNTDGSFYNNSAILLDPLRPWGTELKIHWWGTPALGHYCLSKDDRVLIQHAYQLRDAGIDFIILDSTNQPWTDESFLNTNGEVPNLPKYDPTYWGPISNPRINVTEPAERLMRVWSMVPGAPKVVPWVAINAHPKADMALWFQWRLFSAYPEMRYFYEGKPLILAVTHQSDDSQIAAFEAHWTVRKMWGHIRNDPARQSEWSFMEECQDAFKAHGGGIPCDQRVAIRNGAVEQISASAAYQRQGGFISNLATGVPKFGGQTFRQQIAEAYEYPAAKILTINSWNEWWAVRFPCHSEYNRLGLLQCDTNTHLQQDGTPIFMDAYDHEYNRDLEPGGWSGDAYYRIMVQEIHRLKGGPAALPAGSIEGYIDGVGSNTIRGWACARGVSNPIDVHLYLNGPYGFGEGVGAFRADRPSESAVAAACGSTGANHRFEIPLDSSFRKAHVGKAIFVHGISPADQLNGLLRNSGSHAVPSPPTALRASSQSKPDNPPV